MKLDMGPLIVDHTSVSKLITAEVGLALSGLGAGGFVIVSFFRLP